MSFSFDLTVGESYNRPLMFGELPERIEPLQLAQQGVTLEGSLALGSMERLRDSAPPDGRVRLRLAFASERGARPTMSGSFDTTLLRVCQRCMQPMLLPLSGEFRVALVADLDAADRLEDKYDVLQVGERPMLLKTIIEDELLLAVPAVTLHPLDACVAADWIDDDPGTPQETGERPNPFAVLATLKQRNNPE